MWCNSSTTSDKGKEVDNDSSSVMTTMSLRNSVVSPKTHLNLVGYWTGHPYNDSLLGIKLENRPRSQ